MTAQTADFFTKRTNDHVPSMSYAADVLHDGMGTAYIPALAAADANGILAAFDTTSAATTTPDGFAAAYTGAEAQMGKYGRNVTVVCSGANTDTVIVNGRDYLGQFMSETLTLNGTTPVAGLKAFRWIDSVTTEAQASVTVDVGWGDVIGLPYKVVKLVAEVVDGAEAGSAGAIVAGLATATAATATNADTRGTYAPHATNVADGSKTYELTCLFDNENLHGNTQYAA